MKNKGFTLMEVAVTIAIVVLLGVAIASTCLVAASNAKNTKNINFAINEMQNVQALFSESIMVNAGNVTFDNLQENILSFYNGEIVLNKQQNLLSADLFYNDDYTLDVNANNCVHFSFCYQNKNITMSAQALQKQNIIYSNENIFFKRVEV